jgi:KaiC/GvpD/RAD55 family RecA-like ATPase
MKLMTGIKRLDEFLDGGLPQGSSSLIYGAPFIGKEMVARVFLLAGMKQGVPGIVVLTDSAASDARKEFIALDKDFPKYEKDNLVHFVDTYSKTIGAEDALQNAEFVDSPVNLNAVSLAVNNAQRKIIGEHPTHRLVVDSVSTIMAYTNPQTTFRFLQVFLGKTKRAGATSLLVLGAGIHAENEVQLVKHLVEGVIEFKSEQGKYVLKAEGVGLTENRGWVEYSFGSDGFDLTGSFAAGRIR